MQVDNNSRNCDMRTEPSGRNHSLSRRDSVTRDTPESAGPGSHDRGGLRLRDQAALRHDIDQALDFWNIVDRLMLVDNSGPTKRMLFEFSIIPDYRLTGMK